MSRAEFFQEIMPDLKGLVTECLAMDARDYDEFKCEVMECCEARVRPFLGVVLSVIDGTIEKRAGGAMQYDGPDK